MQRYELSGNERLPANITILVQCWFNVGPDIRGMVQPGCEHGPIELYLRTNSDIKNDKINSIIIVQRVLGKSYTILLFLMI